MTSSVAGGADSPLTGTRLYDTDGDETYTIPRQPELTAAVTTLFVPATFTP